MKLKRVIRGVYRPLKLSRRFSGYNRQIYRPGFTTRFNGLKICATKPLSSRHLADLRDGKLRAVFTACLASEFNFDRNNAGRRNDSSK